MFSKNARPYNPDDLPPGKRLRRNIEDLMSSNSISGSRAQELFNDAHAAGDRNCRRLVGRMGANVARDLRRRLLKNSMWPALYEAPIRCWDTKTNQEHLQNMWFLLPHEVLAVMHRIGDAEKLYDCAGYDPLTRQHLQKCEASAGCKLLGLGLWGDGAPCNWDRSETMEVLSWNLPGLAQDWKKLEDSHHRDEQEACGSRFHI